MDAVPSGEVTFLFTDIVDSTRRWERDEARMREAVARHDRILREAIASQGGWTFKTVGDAFHAAFSDPVAAVEAAVRLQRAIGEERWDVPLGPLEVRVALHTGWAEPANEDYLGPPLNRLSRILGVTHGGQILVSAATRRAVSEGGTGGWRLDEVGRVRLRGLAEAETLFQVSAPGLRSAFPAPPGAAGLTGFPASARAFVGRRRELDELERLVSASGLVTLVGPGGAGKTRLAVRLAERVADAFDHAWFVDLAPLADPSLVAEAVARALANPGDGDQVERALAVVREGAHLLVVDNAEHLPGVGEVVARLLAGAPSLHLVVTSRAPLRLSGEQLYPVPPLPVAVEAGSGEEAAAVELFVQRARLADPGFEMDASGREAVVRIARLVDGLPLGIELAAARVRLLPVQEIAARMEEDLGGVLAGGPSDAPDRHRSLDEAVGWSVALLGERERALYRRFGVFLGGADLDAIEAVCTEGPQDVLALVEALVDESLLRRVPGSSPPRFAMLEVIRRHAGATLASSGEAEQVRERHARHFAGLVVEAEPWFRSHRQNEWFTRLEQDVANLRSAVDWSFASGNVGPGLRIVANTCDFLFYRSHRTDMSRWLDLARPHIPSGDPLVDGGVALLASRLAFADHRLEDCRRHLDEAIAIYASVDHRRLLALSLILWSGSGLGVPELFDRAVERCREGIAMAREIGNVAIEAQGLNLWGELVRLQGDLETAIEIQGQGLEVAQRSGEELRVSMLLHNLGVMAHRLGRTEEAARRLGESLDLASRLEADAMVAGVLAASAGPVAALGDPGVGARLIGAAEGILARVDDTHQAADVDDYRRIEEEVRAALGTSTFDREVEAGRRVSIEQAIGLARSRLGVPSRDPSTHAP